MKFGNWLREKRVCLGLSLEQASKKSCLSSERLRSLELGYAERGITRSESIRLSEVYNIGLGDLLERACGNTA